uniref:Uncharacterized protein n=1 Tax=Picea glauca TaxID=3330 RepID=A0A101M5E8_PICGL|nr:hypothetical protein ABT39_MTgene1050 [Picea glauca]
MIRPGALYIHCAPVHLLCRGPKLGSTLPNKTRGVTGSLLFMISSVPIKVEGSYIAPIFYV